MPRRDAVQKPQDQETAGSGLDLCHRENYHGRTASYPAAPVQIPACGTTAPGSSKLLASHMAT